MWTFAWVLFHFYFIPCIHITQSRHQCFRLFINSILFGRVFQFSGKYGQRLGCTNFKFSPIISFRWWTLNLRSHELIPCCLLNWVEFLLTASSNNTKLCYWRVGCLKFLQLLYDNLPLPACSFCYMKFVFHKFAHIKQFPIADKAAAPTRFPYHTKKLILF